MAEKNTTIQLRVSVAEKKLMQKSAKDQCMPLSAWMRLALLNANLRNLLAEQDVKLTQKKA